MNKDEAKGNTMTEKEQEKLIIDTIFRLPDRVDALFIRIAALEEMLKPLEVRAREWGIKLEDVK